MTFGATYFHNDITNLIAANASFTSLENVGAATTEGVETFVSVAVTERFKVRADYTCITRRSLTRRVWKCFAAKTQGERQVRVAFRSTGSRFRRPRFNVGSQVDGNRSFSIQRLDTGRIFS